MANKILQYLEQLTNAPATLQYMADWNDSDWLDKLKSTTPYIIFHPKTIPEQLMYPLGPNEFPLGTMDGFFNSSSSFAVAIFIPQTSSGSFEYEFKIFNQINQQENQINLINSDGSESLLNLNDFLSSVPDYSYTLSFLLNDYNIFPSFDIASFKGISQENITLNLRDILRYEYNSFNEPVINFEAYRVNIVGIRSNYGYDYPVFSYLKRKVYADYLLLFYFDLSLGTFKFSKFIYTSFPDAANKKLYPKRSRKACKNGNTDLGAAIVMPGFHKNVYKIGKHKGYKALQQIRDIPIYRDITVFEDEYHDLSVPSSFKVDRCGENALPMVNLHTHNKNKRIQHSKSFGDTIDGYSAGCQVVALDSGNDGQKWFTDVMSIFETQKTKIGINEFSYFLIEEVELLNTLDI